MNKFWYILCGVVVGAILFNSLIAHAQVSTNYWKLLSGSIQPNIASWTLTLPYLPSKDCIGTNASGLLQAGTCGSGTGGLGTTTPWTPGDLVQVVDNSTVKSIATSTLGIPNYWTLSGSNLYNNSGTNVGIGTATPAETLQVQGNIGVGQGTAGTGGTGSIVNNNFRDFGLNFISNNHIQVYRGAVVITETGQSGATGYLTLANNTQLSFNNGSASTLGLGDTSLSRLSAGVLAVGNGTGGIGNASGTLVANKVGIGTTTPAFPLVVVGTTTASCFSVDNGATCLSGGGGGGGGIATTSPINAGDLAVWNDAGGTLKGIATSSLQLTTSSFASPNISQWTNDSGYLTGNQTITLSGDITGSGSTAITTAYNNVVPANKGGAGTISGLLKANGSGTVSQAVSGTDYAPATSGSSILYGNGSGGFSNVTVSSPLSFLAGTLSLGTVGLANGGTGQTTNTKGDVLVGTGAAWNKLGVGTDGQVLTASSTATNGVVWATSSGYSPSGTTGQLPYFSATNTLTATSSLYLSSTSLFGVGSTSPTALLSVGLGSSATFSVATTTTYSTPGTYSFTAPAGTVRIVVTAWGAGGGSGGGAGGGAGAYVASSTLFMTGGQGGTVYVASGGLGESHGGTGGSGYKSGANSGGSDGGGGGGSSAVYASSTAQTVIACGGGGGGFSLGPTAVGGGAASGNSGGTGGGTSAPNAGGGGGCGTAPSGATPGTGGTPQTGTNGAGSATGGGSSSTGGGGSSAGFSGNGNSGSGASGGLGSGGATAGSDGTAYDSGGGGSSSGQNGGSPGAGGGGTGITNNGNGGNGKVIISYLTSNSALAGVQLQAGQLTVGEDYLAYGTSSPSASFTIQGMNGVSVMSIFGFVSNVLYKLQEIDIFGHLLTGGPTPTINTCSGGSVSGNDRTGRITMSSGTSCSINFAKTWATAPVCTITPESALSTVRSSVSSTVLSVSFGTANTQWSYICQGYQ